MNSLLTLERPDIWDRALTLAQRVTGWEYPPKVGPELCGVKPLSPSEIRRQKKLEEAEQAERDRIKRELENLPPEELLIAPVPEGAMEWLLHEVGHWVAATDEERKLTNYGYGQEAKGVGKAREWQAWAFEEIILAPWGPSREFIPPRHRGGVAFSPAGPMPVVALHHIERQLQNIHSLHVAEWRVLYRDWIEYERSCDLPAWERIA